jgi:hypothetical protein
MISSSLSQDVGRMKSAVVRGTVCNDRAFQPSRVRYARRYLHAYLLQLFLLTVGGESLGGASGREPCTGHNFRGMKVRFNDVAMFIYKQIL